MPRNRAAVTHENAARAWAHNIVPDSLLLLVVVVVFDAVFLSLDRNSLVR